MSDAKPAGGDELQFDRVVPESSPSGAASPAGVVCASCARPIPDRYYDINGRLVCDRCRRGIEAAADVPAGAGPLVTAALCGFGGGIAGAFIYFAVLYFAHLEIGLVAILIGYMVGYTVRKGAGGRGGLRFQVLALALTYGSIALAYAPVVVMSAVKANQARTSSSASTAAAPMRAQARQPRGGITVVPLMLAFIAALPVLVIWSSLPSGLITALIIFFGMRQAWRMTAAPYLVVLGPYEVGRAPGAQTV